MKKLSREVYSIAFNSLDALPLVGVFYFIALMLKKVNVVLKHLNDNYQRIPLTGLWRYFVNVMVSTHCSLQMIGTAIIMRLF